MVALKVQLNWANSSLQHDSGASCPLLASFRSQMVLLLFQSL